MVDVTPLVKSGQQIIQSYADGSFRVSGKVYETAVVVVPDETQIWDVGAVSVSDLSADDFSPLLSHGDNLDVILLGTGKQIAFLAPELKTELKSRGLHVEVMDSGAAARTYNVLMADGRRVAAALLPFS